MPNSDIPPAPALIFSTGMGIFGRMIECYRIGNEFFLYGVTENGGVRVLPSFSMAREVAASAMP